MNIEKYTNLPLHVSSPVIRLTISNNYFKKLHLISDVLLGCFRLYGHALINIAEEENLINESVEQSIETLMTKDSHGLWSATIVKLIQELDKRESIYLSPELATLFGVTTKSMKQPSIKRMTVRNTVIDRKGQKQFVEVTNTPIELLINYRNKYVGHGTVYSETESKQIYELYEPIFLAFLDALSACATFQFKEAITGLPLNGSVQSCSGSIILDYKGRLFSFTSIEQLTVDAAVSNTISAESLSIQLDENDVQIIETFPYFLAHPYKRALEEGDNFKRLHLLKEVLLNYLKYLGLLTASEYFNSQLKIGEVNRAFKNFLYRPQFGHWNAFMRSAIHALKDHNHQWFVNELPEYYNEIETKPYDKYGETSIGKLISFRNHYLGHSNVPSEEKCIDLWKENFGILKDLLVQLDFCKKYTIVSSDKTVSWRLMGDEITQVNLRQKLKSNVAMLNTANEELSIVPFFILPGEYFTKEVSERAKLMVYEQNTGSRIVFFSPESVHGETNNEKVLEQLNLMIREKEKQEPVSMKDLDEASWKAVLKENNEATIQSLLSEKKVIKGIYQERQDAEVALRSWVGARAGLFFLAAEAGSGKTNLLVEMNRQYTERGLDTILLRGNRFRTPNIWEELCYRLNLSADSSLEDASFVLYDQENPLMILIDGANENANSKALFDSIIVFLERYKGGHIKIVLSWRVNTKSELPQADEKYEDLVYSDAKEGNREDSVIARSCHWLKPLNKIEVEGAWNKYVNDRQDKVRRKPNFSYEELTYHDRSLSDQLDNPLLLRLFLELNNGKGLPKSRGGFISIWTLYHEKLIAQ
jgi:adenylylsulfate kinase-like enzyme